MIDTKIIEVVNRCEYYMKNYDCVFTYIHNIGETQTVIDPTDKVCRFCGKRHPEVNFRKKAHAISELVGNKEFVLRNECDTCNSFFGQKLEDDFGKYLGFGRTLSQVYGKEGVPSYKSRDGKSRVDFTDKGIVIQATQDSDFVEQHESHMVFHAVRDAYTPIAVYKSLVKMALSLVSYEQMPYFMDTVAWLKEDSHMISKYDMGNYVYIIERYIPGSNPMQLRASGFIRKDDSVLVPYYQFLLEFANYSYQIIVPCKEKDVKLAGHEIDFIAIPGAYETGGISFGDVSVELKCMGQTTKIKDQPLKLCLAFEKCEMHQGNGKSIDDFFKEENINLKKRLKRRSSPDIELNG